jgi:hypothetical protein
MSVVYLPPRGKPQEAAVFHGQMQRLRQEIVDSCEKVGVERLKSFNQVDSRCLESLLNIEIEHFFNKFDEPFEDEPAAIQIHWWQCYRPNGHDGRN